MGENREDQIGTSDVPVGGVVVVGSKCIELHFFTMRKQINETGRN